MAAFHKNSKFGGRSAPSDVPLSRAALVVLQYSELAIDALAGFREELTALTMLLVALFSDHQLNGELGSLFFPWRFKRDSMVCQDHHQGSLKHRLRLHHRL